MDPQPRPSHLGIYLSLPLALQELGHPICSSGAPASSSDEAFFMQNKKPHLSLAALSALLKRCVDRITSLLATVAAPPGLRLVAATNLAPLAQRLT